MSRWFIASAAVGVGVAVLAAAAFFHAAPRVRGDTTLARIDMPWEKPNPPFAAIGAGSCAGAACHGGPANASLAGKYDAGTWSGSATHFLAADPHRKAFETLQTPLAADIMKHLGHSVSATEDVRCIACHTNPALAASKNPHEMAMRQEGVSCEACHGNSQRWLREHTTWTESNRTTGYEQSGMTKLFDLGERAVACAGCHVGAPADPSRGYPVRDMNHDMIAAGHPRLNFDFATYQHSLPKHWREKDDSPEFEVRASLIGRTASLEMACRLSHDRLERSKAKESRTPWPEFAESQCVSCHHSLGRGVELSILRRTAELFPTISAISPRDRAKKAEQYAAHRRHLAAAPGNVLAIAFPLQFRTAVLEALPTIDHDEAEQAYYSLAALERTRMKREGRPTYDPAFDRLAKSLFSERGNIDITVSDEARADLKHLLERKD